MLKSLGYHLFSLVLGFYLLLPVSSLFSCPAINGSENYNSKKEKVEKCFIQKHNLKKALDSIVSNGKRENYKDAASEALNTAEYMLNLSNDKIKYAVSNFPIIAAHFFFKLAEVYLIEYYDRDLQSVSFTEFLTWPAVMQADSGVLRTMSMMTKKEREEIGIAVVNFVRGINSLEASLIVILEQTKDKTDIFKTL